ncbi:MAG: hypothetical protein HC860_23130 [Alkalinema sp. RU_4_3]|nr:hypothetical protein [Alkalinema sp. RU_4_3]
MQLKSTPCLAIAGLAIVLGVSSPTLALALPPATTCQASIPLDQGASLTYRLIGTFADPVPSNSPQNPIGLTTIITVQRRDRNGQITTLLNRAIVQDYEQIAPDADYSKLPFTGEFRGKPNDGSRLYGVTASKQGLYVSLRPTIGQPQKMQIVHYLSKGKLVRSSNGQCQTQA